jgi:hypothetical protein
MSKKRESLKASIAKDELSLAQSKAKLLQIMNTEKSALGVAARKLNNRKKILLGALQVKKMLADENYTKQILAEMDVFLEKPTERDVFGFHPKPEKPQ